MYIDRRKALGAIEGKMNQHVKFYNAYIIDIDILSALWYIIFSHKQHFTVRLSCIVPKRILLILCSLGMLS